MSNKNPTTAHLMKAEKRSSGESVYFRGAALQAITANVRKHKMIRENLDESLVVKSFSEETKTGEIINEHDR